jgi:hypothetical protein
MREIRGFQEPDLSQARALVRYEADAESSGCAKH